MDSFILESFLDESSLDNVENLTMSEYILQRATASLANGKNSKIIDVVTGDFHELSDFENLSRRIGSALYKGGMRKGDTLIFLTYGIFDLLAVQCGVWRANGVLRASYPEDDAETLLERIVESKAGWILCEPETAANCLIAASQVSWNVEVIVVGQAEGCTLLQDLILDNGAHLPLLDTSPDDPALILCTSGTTGKSKGAVHSHRSLLQSYSTGKLFPLTSEKPNLLLCKATHFSGNFWPLYAFSNGMTCLVMPKVVKDSSIFRAIDQYKPGFVIGFPTILMMLGNDPNAAKYDLTSLEFAVTGGAIISQTMKNTIMKLPNMKAVLNSYGLTEVGRISVQDIFQQAELEKLPSTPVLSVGNLVPGVRVKIRDSATGLSLGPNTKGEICVKSKSLFQCYHKDPVTSQKAFEDGWFLTGDLGYYDQDGFLYLVARMKDIFKNYNNHISPTELEDVVAAHPAVAEVCVVGVHDPDGGDRIARAFVTLKTGTEHGSTVDLAEQIRQFANRQLSSYKHLKGGLYIVSDLPKGKTGKISRQLVAEILVPELVVAAPK